MNVLVQDLHGDRTGEGAGKNRRWAREEEAQDRQPHICEMTPAAVRRCEEGRDARADGQDQGN